MCVVNGKWYALVGGLGVWVCLPLSGIGCPMSDSVCIVGSLRL